MWSSKNKTGHEVRPVAPVYQPEAAARAIVFGAYAKRREIWLGIPTIVAILANRIAPGFADCYPARNGYSRQMTSKPKSPEAPSNLYEPVSGDYAAHG
jgi:hypothetical protein